MVPAVAAWVGRAGVTAMSVKMRADSVSNPTGVPSRAGTEKFSATSTKIAIKVEAVDGQISGKVRCSVVCSGPAPDMADASSSAPSMARSAAKSARNANEA